MTWIPLTFWHQDDDLITILGTQFCMLQPLMIELRNPTFNFFFFFFFMNLHYGLQKVRGQTQKYT